MHLPDLALTPIRSGQIGYNHFCMTSSLFCVSALCVIYTVSYVLPVIAVDVCDQRCCPQKHTRLMFKKGALSAHDAAWAIAGPTIHSSTLIHSRNESCMANETLPRELGLGCTGSTQFFQRDPWRDSWRELGMCLHLLLTMHAIKQCHEVYTPVVQLRNHKSLLGVGTVSPGLRLVRLLTRRLLYTLKMNVP